MELNLIDSHKALLKEFDVDAQAMWKWMLWTAEVPRGSGDTDAIREKLMEAGKKLGCEVRRDKIGNVVITSPATPGYENFPGVVIQGHMDIVNASDLPIEEYDPKKDGVKARIVDGWLTATSTSLGADDGICIAVGLAICEDRTIPHPHLEVLITVDEETGLYGAFDLKKEFLSEKAKYLINIDSEEEKKICIGSAGGFNCDFKFPVTRCDCKCKDLKTLHVNLTGFKGGHSGVRVHVGLGSSIKQFARIMLSSLECEPRLVKCNAGTAHNAIPRTLEACVAMKIDMVEKFKENSARVIKDIKAEFAKIEDVDCIEFEIKELEDCCACGKPVCAKRSKELFQVMYVLPCEPFRWSPDVAGLVESSTATTVVNLKEDHLQAQALARTSRDTQMRAMELSLRSIAELAGGTMEASGHYPGWLPVPTSKLVKWAGDAHKRVANVHPDVYAVHAGLECGVFIDLFPGMEAVSLGPEIVDPHTTNERCLVSSGDVLFKWVKEILRAMKE